MTLDLSYDWEGDKKIRAKITYGRGKQKQQYWTVFRKRAVRKLKLPSRYILRSIYIYAYALVLQAESSTIITNSEVIILLSRHAFLFPLIGLNC